MSYQAHKWVINHAARLGCRGTALNVLNAMAFHADPAGSSIYPKLQTLAKECGEITVRAVQKAIQKLERSGVLVREKPGGGRNTAQWRIVMTFGGEANAGSPERRTAVRKAVSPSILMNGQKKDQRPVLRETELRSSGKPESDGAAPMTEERLDQKPDEEALRAFKAWVAEFMQRHKYPSNARDGGRGLRVRPVQAADGSVFDMGERDGDASR